ncbi:hypothetical protein Y032_0142g2292 [Ancylostoma ceylanicum]|uniref:Uncharacterized protein n=1 Tax=Ancylostoma ceylanicum TaxID=53326 RepID=A0A016T393_9BILA|nr:hypothetical protein Y032_0142g2292 [Ancylostoma ceylanicum]
MLILTSTPYIAVDLMPVVAQSSGIGTKCAQLYEKALRMAEVTTIVVQKLNKVTSVSKLLPLFAHDGSSKDM